MRYELQWLSDDSVSQWLYLTDCNLYTIHLEIDDLVRCSQIRAKQSQATLARSNSHGTPCRRTPTTEGHSLRNDSSCWRPASKKNHSFSMSVTCLDMFRHVKYWKMICCTFKSKYVAELSWCISIRMQVLRHFSAQMLDVHSTWNHKFWDQVQ
jgi:hypothetical protein